MTTTTGAAFFFLVAAAGPARAQDEPQPAVVVLAASRCAGAIVDDTALGLALRIELSSSLSREVLIARADDPQADYRLAVECEGVSGAVAVTARRAATAVEAREVIPLADLAPPLRARTLALAVAEQVRTLAATPAEDRAPAAPRSPATTSAPTVTPAATRPPGPGSTTAATTEARPPEPRRPARSKLRLTRDLAIGLTVPSLATLVIGIPLLVIGELGPSQPVLGLIDSGLALISLGGVGLLAAGASLGVYLHERSRPVARITVAPFVAAGSTGAAASLTGSF